MNKKVKYILYLVIVCIAIYLINELHEWFFLSMFSAL